MYCDSLRTNPDIWQLCMQRFGSSGYAEVQFWCLQTLQQVSWHAASLTVCSITLLVTTVLQCYAMQWQCDVLVMLAVPHLLCVYLFSLVCDSALMAAEP